MLILFVCIFDGWSEFFCYLMFQIMFVGVWDNELKVKYTGGLSTLG